MIMPEQRFTDAIEKLGLSRNGAALLLGVTDKSIGRWATGEQPVPQMVQLVLALMVKHNTSPAQATRAIGLRHKDSDFVDDRAFGRKFGDSSPIGRARE